MKKLQAKMAPEFSGARVPLRQLTYGSLYFAGEWDASTNTINNNDNVSFTNGGILVEKLEDETTKEYAPKGLYL